MILLIYLALISLIFNLFLLFYEIYIFKNAPFLETSDTNIPLETSLTIIIPTYNEEINIRNCLTALSNIKKPCKNTNIVVIDDCSKDKTFKESIAIKKQLFNNSSEISIISAGPRPNDKNWVGKNWPCYIGANNVDSDWLLFIDADVVLSKNCIFNAP